MDPVFKNLSSQEVSPIVNPPLIENSSFLKSKKGLSLIFAAFLVLILLISAVIYFMLSKQNKYTKQQPNPAAKTVQKQKPFTYPKFEFTYLPPENIPQNKKTLNTYSIKNSFSEDEISSISSVLGFQKLQKEDKYYYTNINTATSSSYLIFNSETGEIEYNAINENLKIQGNKEAGVKNLLAKLGLDELLECNITYNLKDVKNVTYVECHRPWNLLGAPLFNVPGILNVPENIPLSSLKLGYTYNIWSDPNIINVSTGQNGVIRPNDFNTATIAVAEDNTILSINSNLRYFKNKADTPLISPQDALVKLTQNEGDIIALPNEKSQYTWDDVFTKGKKLTGKNATIDSFELAYLDTKSSQDEYAPYYIIKGTVELSSGHNVSYIQSIPARVSVNKIAENTKKSLQLQTFTLPNNPQFANSNSPTPRPTRTSPRGPSPTPLPPFNCDETSIIKPANGTGYYNSYPVQLPNGETVTVIQVTRFNPNGTSGSTFWLKKNNLTDKTIQPIRDAFRQFLRSNQTVIQVDAIILYFDRMFQDLNKCYLSGNTPSLFIYSENSQEFKITPSYVTYSTPPLLSSSWIIKTRENGTLEIKSVIHNFLYYEFSSSIIFDKQNLGYVIKKAEINNFAAKLGNKLGLNEKETERLKFELNLAILKIDKKYIKVSVVPESELNKKLPLVISPKINFINRYHFLLEGLDNYEKISEQNIPKVTRGSSTLVEIGASEVK